MTKDALFTALIVALFIGMGLGKLFISLAH